MDAPRFDRWTRSLPDTASRRSVLGLAGAALGLAATRFSGITVAKKKHKKKSPKKLTRNSFGCVDVGKACRGKDGNCCSGICQGKKPKKGKKDKSKCVAHNTGGCSMNTCSDGMIAGCGPNQEYECLPTTGKANFCGVYDGPNQCRVCRRDTDCEAEFGPGAACIVYEDLCIGNCNATGGTACLPAGA